MTDISPPVVTGIYAALLSMALIGLGFRVVLIRGKEQISLGSQNNPELLRAMRLQANFCEYVPMALVMMALLELQGTKSIGVAALGAVLLVGRGLHAWGFGSESGPMACRVAGTASTFGVLGLASLGLLVSAVGHLLSH